MKPQKPKFKQTEIGMIPEDWEETTIGVICNIKNGKTNTQDAVEDGEYPLFDRSAQIKRSNKFIFDCEAIIVPGEGKEFLPRYFEGKFDLHQRSYAIWKKENVNLKFVYYWILKNRDYLSRVAVGSTVRSLRIGHLQSFPLGLPPLPEQRAIAKILSDLDSKIELLQKMNKTLETIGQAIFKHWFVDFEFPNEEGKPYKSSGGEMVYNEELGKEIPKGWRVGELGKFIEFVKGKKPKVVFNTDKEGLPQILIDVLEGGKPAFVDPKDMIICNEEDIIMVMDGASSGRIERGFSGVLGSTLAKIKIKELNQDYIYYLLKNKEQEIKENTTGTSIPHADKKKIEKFLIVIPPKKVLDIFKNKILLKQIALKKEIKTLSQLRDSLLPKLISGKIRVPAEMIKEMEKEIEKST